VLLQSYRAQEATVIELSCPSPPKRQRFQQLTLAVVFCASNLLAPLALEAQIECSHPFYRTQALPTLSRTNNCFGASGFRCYAPVPGSWTLRRVNEACDATTGDCILEAVVPFETPGVQQMVAEDGLVRTGS
jgi:hypothetical protein